MGKVTQSERKDRYMERGNFLFVPISLCLFVSWFCARGSLTGAAGIFALLVRCYKFGG